MGLEQGTRLRNGKVIDSSIEESASVILVMAESNSNVSDTNEGSDISWQLSEMRENYEQKINALQSEFSQLRDLLMAVITKTNEETLPSSSRGLSKRSEVGSDMVTGVTETHSSRPPSLFTQNARRYKDDDTDEEGDTTQRSHEERLLNVLETIPQRIKSSTTNTKLLQTHFSNFNNNK